MTASNIFHKGMRVERENRRFSSSGQMFLIAAILVVIALVAIENLLSVYTTFEEKRFKDAFTLDKVIRNLKNEFGYLLGIATLQPDVNLSGMRFFYNFTNFTISDIDAKILYAFVSVNSSTQSYGVTVGNFLNDIINVTLNATNSTQTGFSFIVNRSFNVSREFNAVINGSINITMAYSKQNENITERFPVLVSTQRSAAAFVDITMESEDEFIRSKELYNRTW